MNDLEFQKTDAGREFAIISILLGLSASFFVLLPFIGIWATVPSGFALLLSFFGWIRARKSNGKKGLLVSALTVSVFSFMFVLVYYFFFSVVSISGTGKDYRDHAFENVSSNDSLHSSVSNSELEKVLQQFEDEIDSTPKQTDTLTPQ